MGSPDYETVSEELRKDEKKLIIKEELIKYNAQIPSCAYLPTN